MELLVVDKERKPITRPYLLRLPGWTEQEYLAEAPEMQFCEFVRGEVVMHSPVEPEHQDIVQFITSLLRFFCATHDHEKVLNGPALLQVDDGVDREPDIFVIPKEQAGLVHGIPIVGVVPSLIIEVASPSTRKMDLTDKVTEYAKLGVAEYWVVDKEERLLHQHQLKKGRYQVEFKKSGRVESLTVSGFWLDIEWLWQKNLPPEPLCLKQIEG